MTTDWADEFDTMDADPDLATPRHRAAWLRSWRPLGVVWSTFLGSLLLLVVVLQLLGPPAASPRAHFREEANASSAQAPSAVTAPLAGAQEAAASAPPPRRAPDPVLPPVAVVPPPAPPPSRLPGSVAPPDPALLQPSRLYPGAQLPRIGADRLTAMKAYASPFNMNDPRPRVAILVAGFGMNETESLAAIAALPPAVSIAVSPYSFRPDTMLQAARTRGHEYLLSLPMEPIGYPLNDPGERALLTGASEATNALRLEWSLTRFAGYVGATGALGELRGERFGAAIDQMAPVLDRLADLGLLYVDPRPNGQHLTDAAAQRGVGRAVDVVLDDPPGRDAIDGKLALLDQLARDHAGAIGLAGRPSPVTVSRIAAWAATLSARGLALAPVSVVVQMPKPAMAASSVAVRTNLFK